MHFLETIPNSFQALKIILFIWTVKMASSDICPSLHGKISCSCDINKVECSGIQTNISEVQDILGNFLSVPNLVIKVTALQFENDFKFENMSVQNITLGYDLNISSSILFSELGPSLVSLNLNNNSIEHIDDQFFASLSSLLELHLDFNKLIAIESSIFDSLVSLKYLSIVSNDFNEVNAGAFENLLSLHTLDLSNNNLSEFKNVNIKSNSLAVLKLFGCVIQGKLDRDTFFNLPNLKKLDLSYNKLLEVKPHALASSKNLQFLNLSHNIIEFLQENAFFELSNLTSLDLKANKISMIKTSSFTGLHSLKYLDLSGNRLKAVLCDYTTDFAALEAIYLHNNEIKSFTFGTFYYSPKLKELGLAGNNLECSCELTDTVHYLIENSTINKADLESIFCVVTSTHGYMPVTDYKNSKCVPEEPCRKFSPSLMSDDDDDYDYYSDVSTVTTTFFPSSTLLPTTAMTPTTTHETSSQTLTTLAVTSTAETTVPSTKAESTTSVQSFFTSPVADSTTITEITETTIANDSAIMAVENSSDLSTISGSSTNFVTITESVSITGNDSTVSDIVTLGSSTSLSTITDSSVGFVTTTESFSTVGNDSTLMEVVTLEISTNSSTNTESSIDSGTTNYPTMVPMAETTAYVIPSSSKSTTVVSSHTTQEKISSASNQTKASFFPTTLPQTVTTLLITNKDSFSSSKLPTTVFKALSTTNPPLKHPCSNLHLSFDQLNSDSDKGIIKNFSYDGTTFCLKWTLGSILPPKSRCILKYTFIKGIKSENLKCPMFPGDVKLWSKNEKLYRFCINIYGHNKTGSCIEVSEKTTKIISDDTTVMNFSEIPSMTTLSTPTSFSSDEPVQTTTFLTTKHTEINFETSSFSESSKKMTTTGETTSVIIPLISPQVFNVTSFEVYFNDSSFAYVKWMVNVNEPQNICKLTLTATTQYFDHNEGSFPCKQHTHKLQNVAEDDIFKLCLSIQHKSSGHHVICRYSLSGVDVGAEASSSNDNVNHSSSLIPLICLLVLLVVIVIFIIFKTVYKRNQESDRYDVRAEEEKTQRVIIRPSSSVDSSSVRYSYIAKNNPDS